MKENSESEKEVNYFIELLDDSQKYNKKNLKNENFCQGAQWRMYKLPYPSNNDESDQNHKSDQINKFIAYKVKRPNVIINLNFYQGLFREIYLTHLARHPCVMENISFDLKDLSNPIVVAKFYEGGSLNSFFNKSNRKKSKYLLWGDISLKNKEGSKKLYTVAPKNGTVYTIFMYGIARGVKYLHDLKIIHRDLKPANILVSKDHRPYIADLGLSKQAVSDQQSKTAGTPIYQAPELLLGSTNYSFPVDIFALGLIFLSLTEAKYYHPDLGKFSNDKVALAKLIKKYTNGQIEKPSEDNIIGDLIQQMVSVDPAQRPKIDEVCRVLEDEKHWFPNTVKKDFDDYKKKLDDYEAKHLPSFAGKKIDEESKDSDLCQQIDNASKNTENTEKYKSESKAKYERYISQQILLANCVNSNNEAECSLGAIFFTGYRGIPKDYSRAWRLFEEAKKHGNKQAIAFMQCIVNEIIDNENLKDINVTETTEKINEYKKIAELKNSKSLLIYGMIKEGQGQLQEAFELYSKSANQGNIEARGRLGSLLQKKITQLEEDSSKLLIDAEKCKKLSESKKKEAEEKNGNPKDSNEEEEEKREEKVPTFESIAPKFSSEDLLQESAKLLKESEELPIQASKNKKEANELRPLAEELLLQATQWKGTNRQNQIDDDERKLSLISLGILKMTEKSVDESIEIFNELLKEDHPDACLLLAKSYRIKKDETNEKKYYELAYNEYGNQSAKKILNDYFKVQI